MTPLWLSRIPRRTLAIIAGIMVIVILSAVSLSQCQGRKTAGKQAEVSAGAGGAAIDSGEAAANITSNVIANDSASDAAVAQGQAEIAAAPNGKKGEAAKKAACRMRAYRDSPQCKEPAR